MSRPPPVEIPHLTPKGPKYGRRLLIELHERKEVISHYLRLHRIWQRQLSVFVESALSAGDTFVDVGANIGYFTIIGARAVGPEGRVLAYEPDPDNFVLLRRNAQLNGFRNIVGHRMGLGNASSQAELHLDPTNRGAHSQMPGKGATGAIPIEVRRLDEILGDQPVRPRLVKIDVQGLDFAVLEGMSGLFAQPDFRPILLIEFSPLDLDAEEPGLALLEDLVARRDYRLCAFICNDRRDPVPPEIDLDLLRGLRDGLVRNDEQGAEFDIALIPRETRIDWNW